jgi:hypothetical protein
MDADAAYRADEFTRFYTYNWELGYRNTHWGDKAYQLGCVMDCTYGQQYYDLIQAEDLGSRGNKFSEMANSESTFYYMITCDEIDTTYVDYYQGGEDYYYDYSYSTGTGAAQWIGEFLAAVNWDAVGTYLALAWLYVALTCIGPFVFPPFVLCIYMTDGDLDTCSMGVWGNDYTDKTFENDEEDEADTNGEDVLDW